MGFISKFKAQYNVYKNALGDVSREHDLIILDAERALKQARMNRDKDLETVAGKFVPASAWTELDKEQKNKEAWNIYLEECALANAAHDSLNYANERTAANKFSCVVRNRAILRFLVQNDNQEKLISYAKSKFVQARDEFDTRGAKRFRALLAAVGQEVDIEEVASQLLYPGHRL
ncbi:hypothetical protein Lalb_Chr04g0254261 [Lupinus albus]|uniref:Uncharacterized protein n=1 Tax=Lupinus albus TaxID=3870 RepID=A0A6A4QQ31_LUPAL|nr:hypothetical protein Lalb_Chr04g0254261 [Lupinus albus]